MNNDVYSARVFTMMKHNGQVSESITSARWIWAENGENAGAWWMFRNSVALPPDCREARLLITAAFHYLLYVNGTLVTRGPARSFDFRKAYDVVDVQGRLRPGDENVVAILAPANAMAPRCAILAALQWRNSAGRLFTFGTDHHWKVRRHEAFESDTAGRSMGIELLLGREERFDARLDRPGWTTPGFNDADWTAAVEIGPARTPPWTDLAPSGIRPLSDEPLLPLAATCVERVRRRRGYQVRFVSPDNCLHAAKIFATEVSSDAPAAVRFHTAWPVYLNGRPIARHRDAQQVTVPAGESLLCVYQSGYYTIDMELLIETDAELSFSARRLSGTGDVCWALFVADAGMVDYPWHQAVSPSATGDVAAILSASGVRAVPPESLARFTPIGAHRGSVSLEVRTQRHERDRDRLRAFDVGSVTPYLVPATGCDAEFMIDFTRETIGYVEFTVDAPDGAVIDVLCFELIGPYGIDWMQHNGFRYTCREGRQTFTSHIRRGFRYLSITVREFDRPVTFELLRCRETVYPVREQGRFECSDPGLNRAYRMSLDTARLCMLDTYVDCPGHEQSFWVGDAHITALVNLLAFGAYDLDQRSIRLVGQSLLTEWAETYRPHDRTGARDRCLPIAAFPDYPEGGLPMWTFLWLAQCYNHWLYGGAADDLKENYGYVAETLRRCRLLTNYRGLFDMPGAWNLIDWANNDLSPYGEVTAGNVLLVRCSRLAAEMAEALALEDEARAHADEADRRSDAVNRLCWDHERQAYVDTVRDEWAYERYRALCVARGWTPLAWESYAGCRRVSEQTNTLALLCDCLPPERLDAVKRIVRRVERGRFITGSPAGRTRGPPSEEEAPGGIVAVGSPFFLFFSLGALFGSGEGPAALAVIRREWGKMAEMGFRTCPETFGWPRSAAHGWSTAPAVYLPTRVLGIRPLAPGHRTFTVDPVPGDLEWARGAVATPHGPIHVSWRRTDRNELDIRCAAPVECRRIEHAATSL